MYDLMHFPYCLYTFNVSFPWQVLAELKAEFGYDVNPMDESMAIRIAERETVLRKEEREMKKQLRNEMKQFMND